MEGLHLLKLGGSLITDKHSPSTPRLDVLKRLSAEIAAAKSELPTLRLIIGHGSGSFGHRPAQRFGTRQGVHSAAQWLGFAEVWREARALNEIVMEALLDAGLPVIAFPPSGAVLAQDGQVQDWPLQPMQTALEAGLLPVINGDVVFDTVRGGTILSTEELFDYLTRILHPTQILLAGLEKGVWEDFPACTRLIETITPSGYAKIVTSLGGSSNIDVTGGMLQKVHGMVQLVQQQPGLNAVIFSGQQPDLLRQALLGSLSGTIIRSEQLEGGFHALYPTDA